MQHQSRPYRTAAEPFFRTNQGVEDPQEYALGRGFRKTLTLRVHSAQQPFPFPTIKPPTGDTTMAELNQAQLLELVNTKQIAEGNARTRALTQRIVTDLFKTIDEMDVTPDEFWKAVDWLTRLGQTGQAGLITAGLGFDRLLDIRLDEA